MYTRQYNDLNSCTKPNFSSVISIVQKRNTVQLVQQVSTIKGNTYILVKNDGIFSEFAVLCCFLMSHTSYFSKPVTEPMFSAKIWPHILWRLIILMWAHDDGSLHVSWGKIESGCTDSKYQNCFISDLAGRGNGSKCWKTLQLKFFFLKNVLAHRAWKFQQFLENLKIKVLPWLAY